MELYPERIEAKRDEFLQDWVEYDYNEECRAAYIKGYTDGVAGTFSRERVEEAIRMARLEETRQSTDEIINNLIHKP